MCLGIGKMTFTQDKTFCCHLALAETSHLAACSADVMQIAFKRFSSNMRYAVECGIYMYVYLLPAASAMWLCQSTGHAR